MTADNSAPRTSLLDKELIEMSEDELRAFVQDIRAKRTSHAIAEENKPTRKARTTSSESPTKKAALMASLLSDEE